MVIDNLATAAPWPVPMPDSPAIISPLAAGDTLHGVLVVAGTERGDDEARLLAAFAGQAALAMERVRAQEERALLAVLEDRERIARDLHDLVIQRLFAAGMTLQSTDAHITDDKVKARLSDVADDLDGTIRELRQAIYQLQTPVIADDFRHEVQRVVDRATSSASLKVRVRFGGAVGTLVPDRIRPHLLAVIAEALSNAIRHAGAASVDVIVTLEEATVSVVVEDDGRGMAAAVTRRSGLGNLETRATELGGRVTVGVGSRGVGTRVTWAVPA
jgi:signal transduction histidine kinase